MCVFSVRLVREVCVFSVRLVIEVCVCLVCG